MHDWPAMAQLQRHAHAPGAPMHDMRISVIQRHALQLVADGWAQ